MSLLHKQLPQIAWQINKSQHYSKQSLTCLPVGYKGALTRCEPSVIVDYHVKDCDRIGSGGRFCDDSVLRLGHFF